MFFSASINFYLLEDVQDKEPLSTDVFIYFLQARTVHF